MQKRMSGVGRPRAVLCAGSSRQCVYPVTPEPGLLPLFMYLNIVLEINFVTCSVSRQHVEGSLMMPSNVLLTLMRLIERSSD